MVRVFWSTLATIALLAATSVAQADCSCGAVHVAGCDAAAVSDCAAGGQDGAVAAAGDACGPTYVQQTVMVPQWVTEPEWSIRPSIDRKCVNAP